MAKKITKTQQAYANLRKMILTGKFNTGSHWTVRSLAELLGFSSITINQALKQLQQEGLLEIRPQSGISLAVANEQKNREMGIFRSAIEVQAARLLAIQGDKTNFKKLADIAEKINQAIDDGKSDLANEYDYEFHTAIVKLANCDMLADAFEKVITLCMISTLSPANWFSSADMSKISHEHIVEQISSGDPDKAQNAIREHLAAE